MTVLRLSCGFQRPQKRSNLLGERKWAPLSSGTGGYAGRDKPTVPLYLRRMHTTYIQSARSERKWGCAPALSQEGGWI